jgi:hypothetical protein
VDVLRTGLADARIDLCDGLTDGLAHEHVVADRGVLRGRAHMVAGIARAPAAIS